MVRRLREQKETVMSRSHHLNGGGAQRLNNTAAMLLDRIRKATMAALSWGELCWSRMRCTTFG